VVEGLKAVVGRRRTRCRLCLEKLGVCYRAAYGLGCRAFVGRRFDDFPARAPRSPVTDFPQSGGGFTVAFVCCGAVRRLETGESGLDGSKLR
jgi:hypothetical protein